MRAKAATEAAYFADQKDDPTASSYALEYLRKHSELANESVPWHAHDLDPVPSVAVHDNPVPAPVLAPAPGGR